MVKRIPDPNYNKFQQNNKYKENYNRVPYNDNRLKRDRERSSDRYRSKSNERQRIQKEIRDNEKKTESAGISRKQEHANLEKIADSHTVNDYMFNTSS